LDPAHARKIQNSVLTCEGGGLERERGGEREREVLAIQVLNGRQKEGWGRELPTSVWRHFLTPSCC
jgi:hypothetical protein